MTENIIKRMGELQAIIDAATAEMNELKEQARISANGEQACYQAGNISVTVTKPGKPSTTLDTAKLKAKAPKMYAELMTKYSKTGSPKAAAVKVYISK